MYTVYYNAGEGWIYGAAYYEERSAIEMIALLRDLGYQAESVSPDETPGEGWL